MVQIDRRWVVSTGVFAALAPPAASAGALALYPLMEPGVAHDLAVLRSGSLSDVSYALSLDLTQRDRAGGVVGIEVSRHPSAGDLILDFRGLDLEEVVANARPVEDCVWRNGHLRIPERYLRSGVNQIRARFTTPITPSGSAIIRFDDTSDGASYLYTLLVPSDANLLFPCFDQPDLKARFRWRLKVPGGWSVLANARVEARDQQDDWVKWRFAPTEPIPTYLAAFAAGPFAEWASAPPGERPITLYARASRRKEVDAQMIIDANRAAARWLENWFGIAFPFSKLDALLAPAFPFGGMEHVGEIFYNENSFIFREPPTLSQRLGRDSTIYHEVSHQWFGDLVTMTWFDDLWLKEGFATYMGARVQAELNPTSEAWKTFYLRNKPVAYAADATRGTNSVWQPLANLEGAKSNYGPIVYNKAPSIIKQLGFLVGDQAFRAGLHRFLKAHAYANATWRDLLSAVEAEAGVSLTSFGAQYILRAGMARVETSLSIEDGKVGRLVLTQRPERVLPGDPGGFWPIKVKVRLGYADKPDRVLTVRFEAAEVLVAEAQGLPAPDYVWANDGDYGYGLFLPDARSAAWIAAHVASVKDGLLRAMMWGALWDLVRETRLAPAGFVEIAVDALPKETDEQIANVILDHAATALVRFVSASDAERLFPVWEDLLIRRAQNPALEYGLRKDSLDSLIATGRSPGARKYLADYLSGALLFDGAPVKQVTRWRIVTRLLALGDPDAEALYTAEVTHDQTPEAGRSAYIARAATPIPAIKTAYFGRYLQDARLNEEWVSASLGPFNTPDQASLTQAFIAPALAQLDWIREHRRIFFLPAWINAFIGGQESQSALEEVDGFLALHPALPVDIRRKVLEARDELERTVLVRRKAGAAV